MIKILLEEMPEAKSVMNKVEEGKYKIAKLIDEKYFENNYKAIVCMDKYEDVFNKTCCYFILGNDDQWRIVIDYNLNSSKINKVIYRYINHYNKGKFTNTHIEQFVETEVKDDCLRFKITFKTLRGSNITISDTIPEKITNLQGSDYLDEMKKYILSKTMNYISMEYDVENIILNIDNIYKLGFVKYKDKTASMILEIIDIELLKVIELNALEEAKKYKDSMNIKGYIIDNCPIDEITSRLKGYRFLLNEFEDYDFTTYQTAINRYNTRIVNDYISIFYKKSNNKYYNIFDTYLYNNEKYGKIMEDMEFVNIKGLDLSKKSLDNMDIIYNAIACISPYKYDNSKVREIFYNRVFCINKKYIVFTHVNGNNLEMSFVGYYKGEPIKDSDITYNFVLTLYDFPINSEFIIPNNIEDKENKTKLAAHIKDILGSINSYSEFIIPNNIEDIHDLWDYILTIENKNNDKIIGNEFLIPSPYKLEISDECMIGIEKRFGLSFNRYIHEVEGVIIVESINDIPKFTPSAKFIIQRRSIDDILDYINTNPLGVRFKSIENKLYSNLEIDKELVYKMIYTYYKEFKSKIGR